MVHDWAAGRRMEEVFREDLRQRGPWTRRVTEWVLDQITPLLRQRGGVAARGGCGAPDRAFAHRTTSLPSMTGCNWQK